MANLVEQLRKNQAEREAKEQGNFMRKIKNTGEDIEKTEKLLADSKSILDTDSIYKRHKEVEKIKKKQNEITMGPMG